MDLKRELMVVITAAVLLIATLSACNNDNDRQVANLEFAGGDITLAVGKNAELPLMIVYNDGSKEPCSFNDRSKGISVSSRNESVVVVTSEGILVPVSKGYTAIDAVVEGISASVNVFVNDSGDIPFPNPKMTLKPNSIYLFANNNRGMQVFEMLDDGSVIISVSLGTENKQYFERIYRDGRIDPAMQVSKGDHGDSMSIEETGGEIYVWFSSFDSDWYEGPRLIVRSEFKPGESYTPEDFSDLYYYGDKERGYVSVDDKHDLLAIFCHSVVRVYRLSEAKKAALKEVEFKRTVVNSSPVKFTRIAHDLTTLDPIAVFSVKDGEYNGSFNGTRRPMQGFCVYKDLVYFHLGAQDVAVTVLDFNGNYRMQHVELSIEDDKEALINNGLLDPKYNFEPEGIQIQDGHVFLGFTPFWDKVLVVEMEQL